VLDPYGALNFLARQPFVVPDRVAAMGVSGGGTTALSDVERDFIQTAFQRKFRAAIALYPNCNFVSGPMNVPTLILIGERDDWVSPKSCQDLAAGRRRNGSVDGNIRLVLLPGAYHAFDNTTFRTGERYLGHWLAYDPEATRQSVSEIRVFLHDRLGE
jgi:dienelactone hydrolase